MLDICPGLHCLRWIRHPACHISDDHISDDHISDHISDVVILQSLLDQASSLLAPIALQSSLRGCCCGGIHGGTDTNMHGGIHGGGKHTPSKHTRRRHTQHNIHGGGMQRPHLSLAAPRTAS